jgi:hypothetical protein
MVLAAGGCKRRYLAIPGVAVALGIESQPLPFLASVAIPALVAAAVGLLARRLLRPAGHGFREGIVGSLGAMGLAGLLGLAAPYRPRDRRQAREESADDPVALTRRGDGPTPRSGRVQP